MSIHIDKSLHIPIKISLGRSGIATSKVVNIPKAVHDYCQIVLHQRFLKRGGTARRGQLTVSGDIINCQDWQASSE